MSADSVFVNGRILATNGYGGAAEAIAVRDGRVVFVGSTDEALRYSSVRTSVHDLKGGLALPGFADAHAHLHETVDRLYAADLYGLLDARLYVAEVAKFAAQHKDMPVIMGKGWSEALFPIAGPSREMLDEIVSDRPVALWSDGHHALWVNSKALEVGGVAEDTPDPPHGVIERRPGGRDPSGTLREAAAFMLMRRLPDYSREQYEQGILTFQDTIAGPLGITLIHDPYLELGSPLLDAFEELASTGQLSMRVRGSLWMDPEAPFKDQVAAASLERQKHRSGLFQLHSLKFLNDGVIEGHSGYLKSPYLDGLEYAGDPQFCSEPIWKPELLRDAFLAADAAGFQIHVHAIGDAAITETLDALAQVRALTGRHDWRPSIAHLQIVDPKDIDRMRELGAVAVTQPFWFLVDDYHEVLKTLIGEERADQQYPMKSFLDAGIPVAASSDFPVTALPDPLDCIQTGVMRWFPESPFGGRPKPGIKLWPEESVNVRDMISICTLGGAYANYLEDVTGSLAPGKSADLVVLDRDILESPVSEIGDAQVRMTMFRGDVVYSS